MLDKIVNSVIGDLGDKKAYRMLMKRVRALPKDYQYTFRKIQQYIYTVGGVMVDASYPNVFQMFTDLLDLFEDNAAQGKAVLDVIGNDVSSFCDEFMQAYASHKTPQEKLNQEILQGLARSDS